MAHPKFSSWQWGWASNILVEQGKRKDKIKTGSVFLFTHDTNSDTLVLKLSHNRAMWMASKRVCSLTFEDSCFLCSHLFPLEVLYGFREAYQHLWVLTPDRRMAIDFWKLPFWFGALWEHLPTGDKRKETSPSLSFSPAHARWEAAEDWCVNIVCRIVLGFRLG